MCIQVTKGKLVPAGIKLQMSSYRKTDIANFIMHHDYDGVKQETRFEFAVIKANLSELVQLPKAASKLSGLSVSIHSWKPDGVSE